MTEVTNTRHFAIYVILWDVMKMSGMFRKHKLFTTGIIGATLGLGVAYFLRKYGGNKIKKITSYGVRAFRDRVVVVNSFRECEVVAENLLRKCADFRVLGFDCEWVTDAGRRRPVALLQLASEDGFCALILLCQVKQLPEVFKDILEDATIFKVGVVPCDDAAYLLQDYNIIVRGCLDLRHLMQRSGTFSRGGLSGMAENLLGIELDKSSRIRCSDWEVPVLSARQVQYASQDALVAVAIFSKLIKRELRPWWHIWGPKQPKWSEVIELCQNYIDVKYKDKSKQGKSAHATPQDGSGQLLPQVNRHVIKPGSRAYSTRQKPLYDNCILQAPDGEVLSTCDHRKAEWYLFKKLGVKVCDNPLTVRLMFEPSGRAVDEVGQYYTQEKANRCVVCGSNKSYIRKNIVPREYRKHFPVVMKDHISHDVLLLCLDCHLKSNSFDVVLRQQLARKCNAPIGSYDDVKMLDVPDLKQVRSAARALLSSGTNAIPLMRRRELQEIVLQHFGVESGTELSKDMLQRANDVVVSVMNGNYKPHGLRVVMHFSDPKNGGLMYLEQRWREHFLTTMCPRYLPALWSVQHNHQRLKQRIVEGRIQPEEVSFAGIKLDEW